MAAHENPVDGTVGAGFKPAHTTAAPQNSPNSPICVVLQLARLREHHALSRPAQNHFGRTLQSASSRLYVWTASMRGESTETEITQPASEKKSASRSEKTHQRIIDRDNALDIGRLKAELGRTKPIVTQ